MQMGGAFPEAFVSVLSIQNASLSRSDGPLVLVSVQGNRGFTAAARQMRQLFGPRVGAARHDVSIAASMNVSSDEETDFCSRAIGIFRALKSRHPFQRLLQADPKHREALDVDRFHCEC